MNLMRLKNILIKKQIFKDWLGIRVYKACNLQRHAERCSQGETVIECPAEKVELPQTAFEKAFIQNIHLLQYLFAGLNKKQHFVKFTFTTLLAGMEVKDGLSAHL